MPVHPRVQKEAAFLFNTCEFPRQNARSLFVEFYAGDILSVRSDALVVSAYRRNFHPTRGSLLGAISDRFGYSYGVQLPEGTISVNPDLHCFPAAPCLAFNSLWVLEIKDLGDESPLTLGQLVQRLSVLDRHMPKILATGAKSLSLMLLGTGSQGLDITHVIRETLKMIRGWARTAQSLDIVRVVDNDIEKIALLNRTIDDVILAPTVGIGSALLDALTAELSSKVGQISDPMIKIDVHDLLSVTSAPSPSASTIAILGRRLAEHCGTLLHDVYLPGTKPDWRFRINPEGH